MGLDSPAEDPQAFARAIAGKLCGSLQMGSVILLELRRCDYLADVPGVLPWLIEQFWQPLVHELAVVARDYYGVTIIALLFLDADLPPETFPAEVCCTLERFERRHVLEMTLCEWSRDEIRDWITRFSGMNLPRRGVDRMADTVFQATGGIPSLVAQQLLDLCAPPSRSDEQEPTTMTDKSKLTLPADRRPPGGRHPKAPKTPEPYVATDELTTAVNLAIYLRRPLLLEGDAGCGKSRLARYVAYKLGLPLYEWSVRSTSRAQDGLYTYDSILRLHDVQLQRHERQAEGGDKTGAGRKTTKRDPENPMDYVTFGALGTAFREEECPAVVLIDEIDKADIDFPNDLLTVLDDPWKFEIHEADEPPVQAKHPPIVIITSNKEKGNLPAPFLRRCIYYYIDFPSDRLKEIVDAHYAARAEQEPIAAPSAELVEAASARFLGIRDKGDLYKKPGTSEFLDWLEALRGFCGLKDVAKSLRDPGAKLIYPKLLFKLRADWQRYAQA